MLQYDERWTVRDLGSRNGTFVDGDALDVGQRRPLAVGQTLGFGTPEGQWHVLTIEPPAPCARWGDDVVEGEPELLALPSEATPEAVVIFDDAEGWLLDDEPVRDGAIIEAGGRPWKLVLPEALPPTQAVVDAPTLSSAVLRFLVSSDEEYVELSVVFGERELPVEPRAHLYLLLTLARARLADAAEGASALAAGWRHVEDVQRMLRTNRRHLNIWVHRLRKSMEALGIEGGTGIVERRRSSEQIRVGCSGLDVRNI